MERATEPHSESRWECASGHTSAPNWARRTVQERAAQKVVQTAHPTDHAKEPHSEWLSDTQWDQATAGLTAHRMAHTKAQHSESMSAFPWEKAFAPDWERQMADQMDHWTARATAIHSE
jgi:hypothetical protein